MNFIRLVGVLALLIFCTQAGAAKKGELLIWIGGDKGFNGLTEIGKDFEQATGIKVTVDTPDGLTKKFSRMARTARGPDIVIWAHDTFGNWINEGLLQEVTPSEKMEKSAAPFSWQAVTIGKQVFGFPIAIEAVSLIYNKALVTNPPRTLKEVNELAKKLSKEDKAALEWDYNNTYFTWPIIASTGAYSFSKKSGTYNLADVGFDTRAVASALAEVTAMVDSGVLAKDADYDSMMKKFKSGKVAAIINGPWAWEDISKAGIDFGVAHVPAAGNNNKGKPFVGILAAAISSGSREKALAQTFLEDYALTYEGLKKINSDVALGAVANIELMKELGADPRIRHTFEAAQDGELMPDIPEMKSFWKQFQSGLPKILQGKANPQKTLKDIAAKLRKLDKAKGFRRRHYPSGL